MAYRKYVNGEYIEVTQEEFDAEQKRHMEEAKEYERNRPLTEVEILQKKLDALTNNTVTDEVGNVYKHKVNTDGTVTLEIVESYTGELFE